MLQLHTGQYTITVDNDSVYRSGSADNRYTYNFEYLLGEGEYGPLSQHTLRIMDDSLEEDSAEVASCILLATEGLSGVHEHSAVTHGTSCVVAVGAFLCSLDVPSLSLRWHTLVDDGACFGVYEAAKHQCLLSHGELSVACVSTDGEIVWRVSGKEIFTNGFRVYDDYVEAVDWDDETYRIDIASGRSHVI